MTDFGNLDSLKITVLAEDSVLYESPYLGQHGISMLLEAFSENNTKNILVDVAQNPEALLKNMELMQKDPSLIDMIVLTHCHYDHTQGLAEILKHIGKKNIPVVSHPDLFRLNFVTDPYLRHVGVGDQDSREKIEAAGGILFLTRSPLQLFPGLFTTGEVPRKNDFEEVGIDLKTIKDGKVIDDQMPDDISVIARIKGEEIFIITGCSHAGIVNISQHAQIISGVKKIKGIIGGFHLIEAKTDRIIKTVTALNEMKVEKLFAGHCTGFPAQVELFKVFKERFEPLHTGMVITV
ncbi:MAG: MBL fold metallo-hydrolase [Spirochaetes bacterium]|nr:MAG: MBL fold metallo-hydrolase [Spirochaetota bacterium]